MIGDIGIAAALLSEVVALNYDAVDFAKIPVVGVFVLTLQLSLKCSRDFSRKQSSNWLACAAILVFVNLYCGLNLVSQVESSFTAFILLVVVYFFAGIDSMPPIHFHYNGFGVLSYFSLQVMIVMFSTEVLCNYVSFSTVMEFIPTYLMYQSYELVREVTTMETDSGLHLYTLAIVLGRYDSLRFTVLINVFAYLFTFIDFIFKSYWRGLVAVLIPMLLKNTYLFVNFKLTLMPRQYLKYFLLFAAVSVLSFRLSSH
mmetsp:Transcript_25599/g.44702  ORF Transcript_25599/g.44702 Transcript_25599/m.44702 type:complete len:257 (-) Transcript_25599:1914-2684(-)